MSIQKHPLWTNINRLAIVTSILVSLKVFTYFFQDFLPVFGDVISVLFSAFLPFVIAIIIAFLLEPLLVGVMRTLRIRRPYAAVVSLLLAIAAVSLFIFIIVARLYTELSELAISLPNYGYLVDLVSKQVETAERFVEVNPQVQDTLFSATQTLASMLQAWAKSASSFLLSVLTALPRVFIVIVVSIVATILISSSYPNVKQYISKLFPRRFRVSAQAISEDLGAAVVGFVRSQAILVSVTSLATIGGLLLMGNRYAVTLGVLAGLLDIVPIVGTGMLFVPWAIGLFIMGSFGEGLKLLTMWIIIMVVRQFLEPKVMSKGIGIHPLPTLISMYVGLQLIGGFGLIVGPAIVICYEAVRRVSIFGPPKE
ncbi:sporulation integral membrane protein YtvI [Desulfosporosinus sp.]|uniref:sporulation integral membrane protein YtvI n=1 Tax=Desulfosporosinus sp. TaxID=157907 RepID=UPI000E950EF7|nr:sporulation integral membrane protein YtvI [Desulfosporosinus sp.]MBC2722934.1 sporulation integral membrane protein YtvI [Desulfosporosinus sp.]MBC2728293.1 sporulation integral membrane protein YtvI [Desulfosporosinus sp.]HBV87350.1 sporulation integral membrane protein YtvI [Desulfosporosinus sp.]